MNLKFIGTDETMRLENGKVYDILIDPNYKFDGIIIKWVGADANLHTRAYCSPAALAADWVKPGQKVIVRKKKTAIEDSDAYSKYKRAIKRMKTVTLLDLFLAGFGGGEKRD